MDETAKPQHDDTADPKAEDRREWVSPTSEPRGTVADLVQIVKISGPPDYGGVKRTPTH